MKTYIGNSDILKRIPAMIFIKDEKFLISKNANGKPILFSTDCPHQHGVVEEIKENCFRCPNHGWEFGLDNGQSINAPQAYLKSLKIEEENGKLYVELSEDEEIIPIKTSEEKILPKITLVTNATLLIQWNGFNILTDPWIEGPAIYGSWVHYPPSTIKICDLPKIDFIFVTHEHSDHFNIETLSKFEKNIPIYVPHFGNGRLFKRIKELGFKKVITMPSGQIINLNKEIKSISFKSESLWNDSINYLQLGNFKILNVNDAGFNWKIPKLIPDIDLVCSAFSFGATAYPLSWTHLDLNRKNEIMKEKNLGMLKMIKQIVEMCNAKFFLPFANFNELAPIELRQIAKLQIKNTPKTVVEFFEKSELNTKVLEMFPGESWDGKHIEKRNDHEEFFDRSLVIPYLEKNYNNNYNKGFTPIEFSIEHKTIKKYFEGFSNSELTKQVGKYNIAFCAYDKNRTLFALIKFENGIISYLQCKDMPKAEFSMKCPGGIVQDIIINDRSWDEITYWTEYSRINDEFNIALWKIFHAPWKARENVSNEKIDNIAIATILEKCGNNANKIFEKYGLFCAACDAAMGESIEEGCKIHGLENNEIENLKSELNQLLIKKVKINTL